MIIVETCPECGADLVNEVLCSYPPIPAKLCPQCGWSWVGEREEIRRVPFEPNKSVYESLARGLGDAIAYERGDKNRGQVL